MTVVNRPASVGFVVTSAVDMGYCFAYADVTGTSGTFSNTSIFIGAFIGVTKVYRLLLVCSSAKTARNNTRREWSARTGDDRCDSLSTSTLVIIKAGDLIFA